MHWSSKATELTGLDVPKNSNMPTTIRYADDYLCMACIAAKRILGIIIDSTGKTFDIKIKHSSAGGRLKSYDGKDRVLASDSGIGCEEGVRGRVRLRNTTICLSHYI